LKKIVREIQQIEERVVLSCQKSNKELADKLATATVEISQVKQELKKWQGRLEREMIGVKQQFEREREEQDAKLVQSAEHQEVENKIMKQKIGEIQEIVEYHRAETDRKMTSINVTVNSIQKGIEDGMSDVSRPLREQQNKIEQKAVVDKIELQVEIKNLQQEVNQIRLKTGDQVQVPVHRSEGIAEASAINLDQSVNPQIIDPRPGSSNAESIKIAGNLGSTKFALPTFDETRV
jgi:hypothetical protein